LKEDAGTMESYTGMIVSWERRAPATSLRRDGELTGYTIGDFVDYEKARQRLESLGAKLEIAAKK